MSPKNYQNRDLEQLRRMAEGLLNTGEDQSFRELSEMDAIKMLHELQVHQIELEMQNQELMAAKERVEVANSRYQELYNTSLSGLFTLTVEAVILDLNETGAHMLGKDRSGLKKSNFGFYISDETKPGFNNFIETLFRTDSRQSCDVDIKSNGITHFHLFLTGISAGEGNQCFISAIDLTERSRSEKIHQARLDLIQFSENHSWDDLLEETLNQAEQLTGSIIGFYHCLDEDQKTLTLQNWSSRTKNVYCKAEGKGLHFQLSEAGIWADCLRESRPVIHNNYHALAYKKGLPPGHAALDRELLVPVIRNGKVKAVLGVGNKPEDYVETDVEMVSLLADLAWDITERKKYEVRIMEDEEKWRTLFNILPVGVSIIDNQGILMDFNSALGRILGLSVDELQFAAYKNRKYIHADGTPFSGGFPSEISVRENRRVEDVEIGIVKEDGSTLWTEVSAAPMQFPESSCAVVTTDITRRKEEAEELRRALSRMRYFVDSGIVGVIIATTDGKILEANDYYLSLIGYTRKEYEAGKVDWRSITPPEWLAADEKAISQLQESGRCTPYEKEYFRKDGSRVSVMLTNAVLPGPDLEILGLIQDITERKQAEEELMLSERKFRELFEANTDGITIFYVEEDGTLSKIRDLNENAARMLGYTREEMLEKSPYEIEKDISLEKIKQRESDLRTKGYSHFETLLISKEGNVLPVEIRVTLVNYKNQRALMNIVRDITARKKAEQNLQQYADELVQQNAEKDKLFSIIAHDLRSPFNAFLGLSQLLEEELPDLSGEEIQKIAGSLRNSANKLFRLLENLLQWSMMQRGLYTFNPVSMLLFREISAGLELVREAAKQKMISLEEDVPVDLMVEADAQMIESLLRNLLFNAVKFTPKGGKVKVSARALPGNAVEISIQDNGIGMSPELLQKIFQFHERTNRSGTEGEPSTGLGLIICKELVEKHGGKLWAGSEEGKGSTFCFTLSGHAGSAGG